MKFIKFIKFIFIYKFIKFIKFIYEICGKNGKKINLGNFSRKFSSNYFQNVKNKNKFSTYNSRFCL